MSIVFSTNLRSRVRALFASPCQYARFRRVAIALYGGVERSATRHRHRRTHRRRLSPISVHADLRSPQCVAMKNNRVRDRANSSAKLFGCTIARRNYWYLFAVTLISSIATYKRCSNSENLVITPCKCA